MHGFFVGDFRFVHGGWLEYKKALASIAPLAESQRSCRSQVLFIFDQTRIIEAETPNGKFSLKRNIEIKACIKNLQQTKSLAQSISSSPPELLVQEDIFFGVPSGRLKLRTINQARSELIYYQRADTTGPKCSSYVVFPVTNPGLMRQRLDGAYGIRGIVRKHRTLLILGNIRIHLDEVEGLGSFAELEVVLAPGESEQQGIQTAREIMRRLNIDDACLVSGAYADLLGFVLQANVV